MDRNQAVSDLDYLKTLAESGYNSPLLGGRIGLVWTSLVIPTLIIHGLILKGMIGIPIEQVGFIWLVYGIVGGVLTAILSRGMRAKKGAGTAVNQVSEVIWMTSSLLIFGFAISVVIGFSSGNLPQIAFNFIISVAFATSAMSQAVLARLTGEMYLKVAAILAGVTMSATVILASRPEVYFVAAAGVLLSGVIPSYIELRKENASG